MCIDRGVLESVIPNAMLVNKCYFMERADILRRLCNRTYRFRCDLFVFVFVIVVVVVEFGSMSKIVPGDICSDKVFLFGYRLGR